MLVKDWRQAGGQKAGGIPAVSWRLSRVFPRLSSERLFDRGTDRGILRECIYILASTLSRSIVLVHP